MAWLRSSGTWTTVTAALWAGAAAITVRKHIPYDWYRITGPSMAPLLSPHYHESRATDYVLFRTRVRLQDDFASEGGTGEASELQRGIVVLFLSPTTGQTAVKRVVALAGDTVRPLEARDATGKYALGKPITVPFGHVWIEGDQVDMAKNLDSNAYGPVSKSLIRGIATRIVYPWDRRGELDWEAGWEKKMRGRLVRAPSPEQLGSDWAFFQ